MGSRQAVARPVPFAYPSEAPRCLARGQRTLANRQQTVKRNLKKQASESIGAAAVQSTDSCWQSFSDAASGEWEGVTATFDTQGEPVELPSRYVPDAYREWGQQIFDWQSIASTLAADKKLRREIRRMMPTVGCEADSVAFTEEIQTSELGHNEGNELLQFRADGSYSAAAEQTKEGLWKAEHCFSIGNDERIRLVHCLKNIDGRLQLTAIELHKERKDGPYNGGKVLSGCGGGMPSFAQSAKLHKEDLSAFGPSQNGGYLSDSDLLSGATLLPLKAWSRTQRDGDTLVLEAGCVASDNVHIAKHVYHKLHSSAISIAHRGES